MSNNNFDEILKEIKSKGDKGDAESVLKNKLNEAQSKKLKEVLSDKNALAKLLSTPQAQELLKRFSEEKND